MVDARFSDHCNGLLGTAPKRHSTIDTIHLVVDRAEKIGSPSKILKCKLEEQRLA